MENVEKVSPIKDSGDKVSLYVSSNYYILSVLTPYR